MGIGSDSGASAPGAAPGLPLLIPCELAAARAPTHPRRDSVFQQTSAAYLNLFAVQEKILQSLAPRGGDFATREGIGEAAATADRNAHRHRFVLGPYPAPSLPSKWRRSDAGPRVH